MSSDAWAITIAILGDLIAFTIVIVGNWWTYRDNTPANRKAHR